MELDFKHSELLLVCTYLSLYYAVRFIGMFNIHLMLTRPGPYKESQRYFFLTRTKLFLDNIGTKLIVIMWCQIVE